MACRAPAGLWHSLPCGSSSYWPRFRPPRTARTEETACSPGHPSAKPRTHPGLGQLPKKSLPLTTWSLWQRGWPFAWRPSLSALQKKEDIRTTNGVQRASLLDFRSRRRYRKRSECREFVRQPSGRWRGSRNTGEPSPRPWQRRQLWSNVLIAPLRGKDKRSQARQSAPNFPPRSKAGQRSCVSETSLTRSCLQPTARAAIIESESVFHNDFGVERGFKPWNKNLAKRRL